MFILLWTPFIFYFFKFTRMYEKTVGGERKGLEDYTSNISYVHVLIKMMFPLYLCLSHTDMSKQPSVPPLTPS